MCVCCGTLNCLLLTAGCLHIGDHDSIAHPPTAFQGLTAKLGCAGCVVGVTGQSGRETAPGRIGGRRAVRVVGHGSVLVCRAAVMMASSSSVQDCPLVGLLIVALWLFNQLRLWSVPSLGYGGVRWRLDAARQRLADQ